MSKPVLPVVLFGFFCQPSKVAEKHLVLWDGECGFCRRSVDWLLALDHESRLEALPYQQAPSPPMTPALASACERAVHVVAVDGRVFRAGRAVLFALDVVGWRTLAFVGRIPPFIWAIELGYWVVARNRRWFSKLLFRARTS
ncbi:MAG: DUF393 domain-containing protein [Myxococcota bacterium]